MRVTRLDSLVTLIGQQNLKQNHQPRNFTMLLLQNIEGDSYNPILDNYLIVNVVSYADTAFEELESLLKLVESSHEDLVMVECDAQGLQIFNFMQDIFKLVVCKVVHKASRYYLTVQKCVI